MKMNRTEWIGVVLCIGAFIYLSTQSAPKQAPEKTPPTPEQTEAAKAAETGKTPAGTPPVEASGQTPPAPVPEVPEKTWTLNNKSGEFTFTSKGGGILRARIKGLTPEEGGYAGLTTQELNSQGIGAIGSLSRGAGLVENLDYQIAGEVAPDARSIKFTAEKDGLRTTKEWTMDDKADPVGRDYLWNLKVTIENLGTTSHESDTYYLYAGALGNLHDNDWIFPSGNYYANGESMQFDYRDFERDVALWVLWERHPKREVIEDNLTDLKWAGVHNQYYLQSVLPIGLASGSKTRYWTSQMKKPLADDKSQKGPAHWVSQAGVGLPPIRLTAAGQPTAVQTAAFQIFLGPRSGTVLNKLNKVGVEDSGLNKAMHYRGKDSWTLWGLTVPISRLFLGMLNLFGSWVHSYGLAIIMLTIVVRLAIWPLSLKATRAMKRMAKLAPLQNELKEKYKDDPQKLQVETMKLFREYQVSPFGSCMPLLLQFPIFLGYYGMMRPAVEFRGHSFLWAHDLSMPDTVFHIAGFPVNPLPILMTVTMYIQMAISPKPAQSNPQMEMQMKIFKIMPFFFMFFCYNFASALALYWTVQNIVSIFQTMYTNRMPEPELKKVVRKPGFLEMARHMQEQQRNSQSKPKQARTGGGGAKSAYKSKRDE